VKEETGGALEVDPSKVHFSLYSRINIFKDVLNRPRSLGDLAATLLKSRGHDSVPQMRI
jgi:hypothetical protein